MNDLQQLMKERMTDADARKSAKLICALFDALDKEEGDAIRSTLVEQMDNLIHNATKLKEAFKAGLDK